MSGLAFTQTCGSFDKNGVRGRKDAAADAGSLILQDELCRKNTAACVNVAGTRRRTRQRSSHGGCRTPAGTWREVIAGANEFSRSHRPIMPFIAGSSGAYRVFDEPNLGDEPRFFYPTESSVFSLGQFAGMRERFGVVNVITSNAVSSLNAVGRSHPGSMKGSSPGMGGAANFSFVDGHVERLYVMETLRRRLWGERFWGISGGNRVDGVQRVAP